MVLEKTLESPLDCRRSNQSILKDISPEYSLEGLMLKLTLQYFGHLMLRTDSFEKTLMLGKIEGRRRRQHTMRWLDGIPCRRERLPTPVFWPGEFNGLHSPWSSKESDTTEQLSLHFTTTFRKSLAISYPIKHSLTF